jgi:hypothetical protein
MEILTPIQSYTEKARWLAIACAPADLAAALGLRRMAQNRYRGPCVLCGHRTLEIRDGDRAVLVTCWHGCDRQAVLAELRRRGLLPDREQPADPRHGGASRNGAGRREASARAGELMVEAALAELPAHDPRRADLTELQRRLKFDPAGELTGGGHTSRSWRGRCSRLATTRARLRRRTAQWVQTLEGRWSVAEAWACYDAGSEFREYLHSRGKPNGGAAASDEQEPPWPELGPQALHGLAGEVVAAIDPHTEADPAAVLVHFLVGFGNLIGREPHFRVGGTEHHTNLFACFVGATAAGRKGTAWGEVLRLLRLADPEWAQDRIAGGLSSGEGVIWAVRDPGEDADMDENGDPGASDKRLLIIEPEFAAPLRIMEREGNTLSAVIRQAWDSGTLRILTKRNPVRATDAHISIIGHITRDELLRYLNSTELGNGFANRFLWLAVRRSKLLPDGGCLPENDVLRLADRIGLAAQGRARHRRGAAR